MNAKTFLLLLFLNFPAWGQNLTLTSIPSEAEVVIKDLAGNTVNKFGKTPLTRPIAEITSSISSAGIFILSVEKSGYASQSLLVTQDFKAETKINFNLEPVNYVQNNFQMDKALSQIFEAQRQIRNQQYDEALSLLKKIEEEQNQLSTIPEMIGGVYYLKKDLKSALGWYQKAYRLNPTNKDAYNMKIYLEKALGKNNE